MQHHRHAPSRRTPPPDVVQTPAAAGRFDGPTTTSQAQGPGFIVIGLFALRLAKRLIEGLEYYPGRDNDVSWIDNFLAAYPLDYALAKISGRRMQDYLLVYQGIISRMKKQPRYPIRFMQMNPDRWMQHAEGRGSEGQTQRETTDWEKLNMIDFCDAAAEWGSVVPLPALEADRMMELADGRRIADLEDGNSMR